jgi:hypothetical protein
MAAPRFCCCYAIHRTPDGSGFLGSYKIYDDAGMVVSTWVAPSILSTPGLAFDLARSKAKPVMARLQRKAVAKPVSICTVDSVA